MTEEALKLKEKYLQMDVDMEKYVGMYMEKLNKGPITREDVADISQRIISDILRDMMSEVAVYAEEFLELFKDSEYPDKDFIKGAMDYYLSNKFIPIGEVVAGCMKSDTTEIVSEMNSKREKYGVDGAIGTARFVLAVCCRTVESNMTANHLNTTVGRVVEDAFVYGQNLVCEINAINNRKNNPIILI